MLHFQGRNWYSHHDLVQWIQRGKKPCAEDTVCSSKLYEILEIRACYISVAAVTALRLI